MATYLISYDLNRAGHDYGGLIVAIKALNPSWWHHLDSTWITKHGGPASAIRNILKAHLDENDEILIVRLTGEGAWFGFNEKASSWLDELMA